MPIPKLVGDLTRAQIIEKYSEWEYGWKKEVVFDWIESNPLTGEYRVRTYQFVADAMPCTYTRNCGVHQLTFVKLMPTGIVKTCATCRVTEGPITMELGRLRATRNATINEAWDILEISGQKTPIGMAPKKEQSKFRVID